MRRPSGRCTPNLVTLQRTTYTRDAAGGKVPTFTTFAANVACSIQPDSSEETDSHDKDNTVTGYIAIFHDDHGLQVRNRILYGSRTLAITGVMPSMGGRNRTWTYKCEERT